MPVLFATSELSFVGVGTGVLGGLALFLFGMSQMTGASKQVAGDGLSEGEARRLEGWLTVADKLESVGDLIETNLVAQGSARIEHNLRFSNQTLEFLTPLYQAVSESLHDALQAVAGEDRELACQVVARKPEIQGLAKKASTQLAQRLFTDEPNRVEVFRVESDIISLINRLYYYAKRIAKVMAHVDTACP